MDMETFIKACSRIVLLTREVHLYCKLSDEQLKFTVGLQKKCNNLKYTALGQEPLSIIHYTRP